MRESPDNIAERPENRGWFRRVRQGAGTALSRQSQLFQRAKRGEFRPLLGGLLAFAVIGGSYTAVNLDAWSHTEGLPREEARVIAREDTGETERCGGRLSTRREPVYIVTYRSFDPPGALPPEFARIESCSVHQRGDDVVVVRERRPDGSVKVWAIHPDTRAAALSEAGLWGGGAGVLAGGLILAGQRWEASRRRSPSNSGAGRHGA